MTPEDLEARERRHAERWFEDLPTQVWDETKPIVLFMTDVFFHSRAEVDRFCAHNGFNARELRFLLCEPVYGIPLIAEEFYAEDIGDPSLLPQTILDAVELLNQTVREAGPLSWIPQDISAFLL